jgi:Rrf2 family protein
MRLSVKARYGLGAMIFLAQHYAAKENITVNKMSDSLGISKIYLEQVFSLLRHAELVASAKGAYGGYQLSCAPQKISAYDVLFAIESSLFEKTESTFTESYSEVEEALQVNVFAKLDEKIKETLEGITLADLSSKVKELQSNEGYMYYI